MSSVLFIGGTGNISSECVASALAAGFEVTVLTRGQTSLRGGPPDGARRLVGDIHDPGEARAALGSRAFDVAVSFVNMLPSEVEHDVGLFEGRVGQYVFISSASVYQKPLKQLPVTESTPLRNPFSDYSRNKIACEETLLRAYRDRGFPATIVRPSHTYDRTRVPLEAGWTAIERMRQRKPVVVHGDGTSLWVLTHSRDFASAFVRLLDNPLAIGEAVHITGDEVLTWDEIHHQMARAAGVEAELVHVASETISDLLPEWRRRLLGDKSHSLFFDNTKIRRLAPGWVATVPFARGAREIVGWFDQDPARRTFDERVDSAMDRLVAIARAGAGAGRGS